MTCRDCVHYEVCAEQDAMLGEKEIDKIKGVENHCELFKQKSRFVELPCEVGQTVYDITEFICEAPSPDMYELKADEITIEKGYGGFNFTYDGVYINCEDIGKTLFFTKEEAEKALKERESE